MRETWCVKRESDFVTLGGLQFRLIYNFVKKDKKPKKLGFYVDFNSACEFKGTFTEFQCAYDSKVAQENHEGISNA